MRVLSTYSIHILCFGKSVRGDEESGEDFIHYPPFTLNLKLSLLASAHNNHKRRPVIAILKAS
jgi:hypothetical protein